MALQEPLALQAFQALVRVVLTQAKVELIFMTTPSSVAIISTCSKD
jgi:hypothetical protein